MARTAGPRREPLVRLALQIDSVVLELWGLAAQEAILTGKSVPIETANPVATAAPLGYRRSLLWSGTLLSVSTG